MAIWVERMGNGLMEWTVRTRDELLTLYATQPESTADAVIALQSAYFTMAQRLHSSFDQSISLRNYSGGRQTGTKGWQLA